MSFLTPIWLLGLIPWAGLTLWLLWGRRPRVMVPFVALWQISAVDVQARRNLQTPPIAVALVILSLLLGVLAAAGPLVRRWGGGSDVPVNLVIDRGASMSARTADHSRLRFQALTDEVARRLADVGGASLPIRLIDSVEGSEQSTRPSGVSHIVDAMPPTLMDTHRQLQSTLLRWSRDDRSPLIVITDQPIEVPAPNLLRIAPAEAMRNVGIERLMVRRKPTAQVMVRVGNVGSAKTTAGLHVSSGDWQTRQTIMLPPAGASRNYFVDAGRLGDVTQAELVGTDDDFPADDHAAVAREGSIAGIDARIALRPAMKRLLDAYRAHRVPTAGAPTLAIVSQQAALADDGSGLVLDVPEDLPPVPIAPLTTQSHPMLEGVDFTSLPQTLVVSSNAPPWTPVVVGGGHVLVAVREQPARQVWVGFDPAAWSASPDFVVFFSSCLDWLSAGGVKDRSHPLEELTSDWKRVGIADDGRAAEPQPGIYRRPDGRLEAFALTDVQFFADPSHEWMGKLDGLLRLRKPGFQLANGLLLCSLVALAAAALTWRRRVAEGAFPGHLTLPGEPGVGDSDPQTASGNLPRADEPDAVAANDHSWRGIRYIMQVLTVFLGFRSLIRGRGRGLFLPVMKGWHG